jgi:membrane protease YdiL (CAAX protease family)
VTRFRHPVPEALVLLLVSCALAALVSLVPPGGPSSFMRTLGPTLAVLAWTAPAYLLAAWRGVDPLSEHGLLVWPKRWVPAGFAVMGVLFVYVVGFLVVVAGWRGGPIPIPRPELTPATLVLTFLWHVPFVALPEEYFFRGILQPALSGEKQPWRGVLLASAAFALAHVVLQGDPWRASVFFPSLVFGWLRERTGSLIPPILFHATCNAVELGLRAGWRW